MKTWTKQIITSSGILIASMMIANILNLVFNVFLGRKVGLDDYSTVTIINTFWYFITIFINALAATIVQRIAFLTAKYNNNAANYFFKITRNRTLIAASIVTVLYLLSSPFLQTFFHLSGSSILILVAPSLIAGTLLTLNRAYLHSNFLFPLVAILALVEDVSKLIYAALLVNFGLNSLTYLSIPLSVLTACAVSVYLVRKRLKPIEGSHLYHFPKKFYVAALITSLSANAFLIYDISLAKHFLTSSIAGEYALLSLVGKMIYFMGSLINAFMVVYVSRDLGSNRNPNKTFYRLLMGVIILVIGSAVCLGYFGNLIVPLLLGNRALTILPYLKQYSYAIAAFTIANTIVSYHLARKDFVFPIAGILISFTMIIGIYAHHNGIQQIVEVMANMGTLSLIIMTILHLIQRNGGFFVHNLVDLITIFKPLPKLQPQSSKGKRILIFNWRDTKHAFAGGAEVYIHELAKRWVQQGNSVTMFCGNDGYHPRNEELDGVYIVRRGGFYFVYVWAFLYYVLKFRGHYDIVVDCDSALPFFTPLYAREKIFLVIHHVHQDVFKKGLPPILSQIASILESRFIPWVYQNISVITVSPSSRNEILKHNITDHDPTIIFNGVDLDRYKPAAKSFVPMILYMGRLKQYKSIHIFIQAAKKVLEKMPQVEFVIAGEGDEKQNLINLVKSLKLETKITFSGKVSEEEKIRLYQKAWVAVNPSMMEGWGITVIEANACGTPVIASRVPGLSDSVQNPHTGYLVTYGNVDEFAEKMIELVDNQTLRYEMSHNAVQWAKQYDWNISAAKCLQLFNQTK